MKQLIKQIGIAALCGLGLFSCQLQDDLFGKKTEKEELGTLALSVIANAPASMSTKAESTVDTKDFQVVITGEEKSDGTTFSRTYEKVSEMPATIALSVGKYTVRSNTAGKMEKRMSHPYYAGGTDLSITKDVTSEANVKCTMQNSRIQIQYSEDFKNSFTSWTVTMDDGTESALSFTEKENLNTPIYWAFGENVSQVRVNIRATTPDGNTVSDSRTFLKSMVSEGYGDVNSDNFTGGDALVLDFKPSTGELTGNVQGVNISVSITFSNHTESVQIPVSDKEEPETPTTPTEPETPAVDGLTLTLPKDITMKGNISDAPASADAVIEAKNGIRSMIVKIEPGGDGFREALTDLENRSADDGGPIHFLTGEELVGNKAVEQMFAQLQFTLSAPQSGATSYTFPIGGFFKFMNGMLGAHKFHITLVDMTGKEVKGTLTITLI